MTTQGSLPAAIQFWTGRKWTTRYVYSRANLGLCFDVQADIKKSMRVANQSGETLMIIWP